MVRARAEMVRVLHGVLHKPHGRRLLLGQCLFQLLGQRSERCVALCCGAFLGHQLEKRLDRRAAALRQLAAA